VWGRRIIAGTVVGCAAAGIGVLPAAASGCILLCGSGTTTTAVTSPTASAVTIGRVTPTQVVLSGTVGTGGGSTNWQFIVDGGRYGFGDGEVPASPASAAVSNTETSATPGTRYTVKLTATNSAGTASGPVATFTTPLEPALGASLPANRTDVTFGAQVMLTGAAHGANATSDVVQLQQKAGDAHTYTDVPNPNDLGSPDTIISKNRLIYVLDPMRNTRYRFRLAGRYYNLLGGGEYTPREQPSVSRPVSVTVEPEAAHIAGSAPRGCDTRTAPSADISVARRARTCSAICTSARACAIRSWRTWEARSPTTPAAERRSVRPSQTGYWGMT
jgi:hypothetical protein